MLLAKYHSGYQMKKNEMDGEYGTYVYGGQERFIQDFGGET
jgi:hypothetical protein